MTASTHRPYMSRLSIRFAIILGLALLPTGFIAFVQTKALENEVQARSEIALMGATLQSALPETGLIQKVRGIVGSLAAAVPYVVNDPQACDALMKRVQVEEPSASLVAFIPLNGIMTCSTSDKDFDFSDLPVLWKLLKAQEPAFAVNPEGPVSGTSVLKILHPVFDKAGTYLGFTSVSLPHNVLKELRFGAFVNQDEFTSAVLFWTFDGDGTVLTSNIELGAVTGKLPADRPLKDYVGNESSVFAARSASGSPMTYAVVPIVRGDLYLMSSFLTHRETIGEAVYPYLPTFLMWIAGLIGAGLAAEFLVTRHVRTLHCAIVGFARGDRRLLVLDVRTAPLELSELASAYSAMTESITRSEAELEDIVHQKEVLLREVHHRVKNNLQLISSIINIQIRSTRSDEARGLLKNLQERIMSLATVHRGLYQTSGLADVRARELIPDIVGQILSMSSGPEKPFITQNDIDDLRLVPDQAVPLSLLLAEALSNAIKHSGATRDHPGRLSVRLKWSGDGDALFEVTNSTRPRDGAATGLREIGIGSQLITAFVQQLGGDHEAGEVDGEYFLRVKFEVAPLSMAENRQELPGLDDLKLNDDPL